MENQNKDEFIISIPGSCTLKEIKNVIRFHESFLWRFKSNTIDGKMNKTLLEASVDVPLEFDFAPEAAKAPEGKTEEWRGKLRYNSTEQTIALYRGS
jgi:hypothetical protein